jgi:hypothetical protein
MRPKKTGLVLTERAELRYVLTITGRLRVFGVDTISEFEDAILDEDLFDLVIVDSRDTPEMADRALTILNRLRPGLRSVLITGPKPRPELTDRFDQIINEGANVSMLDRLLGGITILLARKRGPRKGSHRIYAGLA